MRTLDTKHNEIQNVLANHALDLMTKQHYGRGVRSKLVHLYDNWEIATGTRKRLQNGEQFSNGAEAKRKCGGNLRSICMQEHVIYLE